MTFPSPNLKDVFVALALILILRRVFWELTTGAKRRALIKKHGCLSPVLRPQKLPFGIDLIFGNFKAIQEHRLLDKWSRMLSDNNTHTILSKFLGQRAYMTDDPENVKWLLSTDFDAWSLGAARIKRMSAFLGDGVFTTDGAAWKHSRDMLRPCFERSRVADVAILDKHMNRYLEIVPKDGSTVDLLPLFHAYALDVVTEFLFGWSTDALLMEGKENSEVQAFIDAMVYCMNPLSDPKNSRWGVLGAIFLPDMKYRKACKTIKAFAETIIDRQLSQKATSEPTSAQPTTSEKNSTPAPPILLDALFNKTQDRRVIRDELLNILAAGGDTMATLLTNLFFEVPRHPDVLSRLRSEIDSIAGATSPTYQQLKELKYTRAVLNESMRLHPVVPSNSREALRDTIIPRGGGPDGTAPLLIPKGSYVAYHTWSMHHRPDMYGADSLAFKPERWLDEASPLRPKWGYIPFSGGPRLCLGQNFALTQALFVVARMVQSFEIEGRDAGVWRENLSITCANFGGAKVGLRLRGEIVKDMLE